MYYANINFLQNQVYGSFFPNEKYECLFRGANSKKISTANHISNKSILCKSSDLSPGQYSLIVQDSNQKSFPALEFFIYPNFSLKRIYPSIGNRGTRVAVYGQNSPNTTSLSCRFGRIITSAVFINGKC